MPTRKRSRRVELASRIGGRLTLLAVAAFTAFWMGIIYAYRGCAFFVDSAPDETASALVTAAFGLSLFAVLAALGSLMSMTRPRVSKVTWLTAIAALVLMVLIVLLVFLNGPYPGADCS